MKRHINMVHICTNNTQIFIYTCSSHFAPHFPLCEESFAKFEWRTKFFFLEKENRVHALSQSEEIESTSSRYNFMLFVIIIPNHQSTREKSSLNILLLHVVLVILRRLYVDSHEKKAFKKYVIYSSSFWLPITQKKKKSVLG